MLPGDRNNMEETTMIRKFVFGQPISTGAVVCQQPPCQDPLPFFAVDRGPDGAVRLRLPLAADDVLFGLGEAVRGINKRGHLYRSWNSDDSSHSEDKHSLYCAHNFLLFCRKAGSFAVYLDDPGDVRWDLGCTRSSEAVITSLNGDFDLYVLTVDGPGEDSSECAALCRLFRKLIGPSYLPPRWAMGYIQSRWGYASEQDLRTVVEEHRRRHIPIDAVCMDIDYMDHFKDFTWRAEAFPDLAALCAALKRQQIRLVPIIDAGVKAEPGYDVYDEGVEKGCFCAKEDGELFQAAVWPGLSCFPDFLRPEVRSWFGAYYHRLLAAGVEGFWNDMNEPALFYSPEGLRKAFETVEGLRNELMEHDASFRLQGSFSAVKNSMEDYRRFYHRLDGRTIRHDKVHNLYGASMTAAAAEGFRSYNPGQRYLLFSRSGFTGAHRDGGMWMGDNCSWWSHILLHLKMLPSLNMVGYVYCGADLGGFGRDVTEDLLLRWLQLGVFTPLMRNHSALHTRDQEIYRFDSWERMRDVITVRYALLPWLYSELMQAALTDGMLFRPLGFDCPEDETALHTEDQLMLGHGCMVAPVYEQNAIGRHVYLPWDMLLVRFRSAEDYDLQPMPAGHHWVPLALNEFPLFIRRGCFVPLAGAAECSEQVDSRRLRLLGWLDGDAALSFYEDDGCSTQPVLSQGCSRLQVCVRGGRPEASAPGRTLDCSALLLGPVN